MKRFLIALSVLLCAWTLSGQELSVSTNFVDLANRGTMNIEAGYGLSQHWSVTAGVKYNPFTFGEDPDYRQSRQRSVAVGARYWPWNVHSGWWASAALRWQEYNTGGFVSPETYEGDRYGTALRAGYAYMLSSRLNLDFGLGLWGGYDVYTVYACPRCGRTVADGADYFFKMSDIIVALSFIF